MAALGQASFDGHFLDKSGQNVTVSQVFEAPFDCILTHASVYTGSAIAVDAYVTMYKNAGIIVPDQIVNAGVLPVFTNQLNGVDLANLVLYKGEKVTIKLNLLSLNTVHRCKWVLACASKVAPLAA